PDSVEFQFADKNIKVSLNEAGEREQAEKKPLVSPEILRNKAEKKKRWEQLAQQYIDSAQAQKESYLQDLDWASKENGLEPMSYKYSAMAVKSKGSILNKFERNEAKGQPEKNSQLTDLLRGTIIINSP